MVEKSYPETAFLLDRAMERKHRDNRSLEAKMCHSFKLSMRENTNRKLWELALV